MASTLTGQGARLPRELSHSELNVFKINLLLEVLSLLASEICHLNERVSELVSESVRK